MIEPVSTAVGYALGKAGKAVEKTGVIKALLLPTAKAYGDDWGRRAKERLAEAAKARQAANLEAHVEAIRGRVSEDSNPDPQLTSDWLDGARDIDPEDKELSAAWRATMLAIARGDAQRSELLSIIKTMTPSEAAAFLVLTRRLRQGAISLAGALDYKPRLQTMGLLRAPGQAFSRPSMVMVLLFISLLAIAFLFLLFAESRGVPTALSRTLDPVFVWATVLMGYGFVMSALVVWVFVRPQPTQLGRTLLRHIDSLGTPQVQPNPAVETPSDAATADSGDGALGSTQTPRRAKPARKAKDRTAP